MKSVFVGYFRPSQDEFTQIWNDSIFAIDANVLLNLYRYSSESRDELEKALTTVEDKLFITHQAAKEFLKNRSKVISDNAKEYQTTIKSLEDLSNAFSQKNKHPFLSNEEFKKFEECSKKWVALLKESKESLFTKLTNDEILAFVEKLFAGKTGQQPIQEHESEITIDGEKRYQKKIPPGYMDEKKDDKYGDLIIWKQIIEYAKSKNKAVIFITDDDKEDWWLKESNKTISPRPELIEEFYAETKQKFWMYTVDRFVTEAAKISKSTVSPEVIEEIISVRRDTNESNFYDRTSLIEVFQEHFDSPVDEWQGGSLSVYLNKPMKYATGTGKFKPRFSVIPKFNVELIDAPYEDKSIVSLSFGCGTTRDFNVHLKSREGLLEAGTYTFQYTAYIDESIEIEE